MGIWVAFILLVALPTIARGAGYYLPDIGVRALGRAGAFVASADDLTAAWYNPAGLALPGTRFIVEGALVQKGIVYQRTDETGASGAFPRADNRSAGMLVPFVAVGSDFGLKRFAASFSFYGPYSGRYEFPENGAQRYSGIGNRTVEAYLQLSLAARPTSWLRVGATFEVVNVRPGNGVVVAILPGDEGTSDARVSFDVSDPTALSGRIGVIASPTPSLDIGASLKLPVNVNAKGTLAVNQTDIDNLRATQPNLSDLEISGNQVSLKFAMPLVLRAGVRFKRPRFDVEANYVWERWAGFTRLEIVPKDMTIRLFGASYPLGPITEDRGYGDSHSVRLGGDFDLIPEVLVLRAGAFFESSAVPRRSLNVSLVESAKFGVTAGLSWRWRWLTVSAAYAHVSHAEELVLDSTSRQINLTYLALGSQELSPVVGNGLYRTWQNIFSLGVAFEFNWRMR